MAAEDKFGQQIQVGDTVQFYYGGDEHEAVVEDISSTGDIAYLTVTPEPIEIPAGSVRFIMPADKPARADTTTEDTEPDPAPKKSSSKGKQ